MPHVFVETNWLFSCAAPAHHQVPAAAELLERARRGEFTLHMPNVCVGEARQAILTKCQPRAEANAIRRFLAWAEPAGHSGQGVENLGGRRAGDLVCEDDADLQPWDKQGNDKPLLLAAFDQAHVWVYGDFMFSQPHRSQDFE